MKFPLLTLAIQSPVDVVLARQRTRQAAIALGLEALDQIQLATIVAEVTTQILDQAGQGQVQFSVQGPWEQRCWVVSLQSPVSDDTHWADSRPFWEPWLDQVDLEADDHHLTLHLGKRLPTSTQELTEAQWQAIAQTLAPFPPVDFLAELNQQHRDLLATLHLTQTQQQELAQQTQQHQMTEATLKQTHAELESFCYSISHDLRAPLRSIYGFSQILAEDYHDQLPEDGQDCLQRIQRASKRMGQLLDDLLLLSRMMGQEMQWTTVDLSAIAQDIAHTLQQTDPQRSVDFHIAPHLHTQGDARLLRIVLENLLGNAWKFTRTRSHTHISFDCLPSSSAYPDSPQDRYIVHDNGVGFNPTHTHKLFGAFQRLHGRDEFEGTGMGLAIAQRIIHRHGGQVWAEGALNQGATFSFTLPLPASVV